MARRVLKAVARERENGVANHCQGAPPQIEANGKSFGHAPPVRPITAPRITTPARPPARLPGRLFCRLEELIIEGLDHLGHSPPDFPAAAKCLAIAENIAATNELPERLRCRMRFFKDAVEHLRKNLCQSVDRAKDVPPLLESKPPHVDRNAEELQNAEALIEELPDAHLQTEMEALREKIHDLEEKLKRRSTRRASLLVPPVLHMPRAGLQAAAVLAAVGGISFAANHWLGRPAHGELTSVNVNVIPAEAELFTNGVAVGNQQYPVSLAGYAGDKMRIEARLAGYSNIDRMLLIPAAGKPMDETIQLQPLSATLLVQSEPAAREILLRVDGEEPTAAINSARGVAVKDGTPMEVSLTVPDYAPTNRMLEALKPGERRVINFGALPILPAALRLKVQPEDAVYSIIYPGHDPVAFGSTNYISGLAPKTSFTLVAQRKDYVTLSNTFNLKPAEICEFDLGRMQPAPASLLVLALPRPFELQVEWDGKPRNFGAAGEAAGLPAGKPLVVTVAADGCEPWSTNLVLEPAESRKISLGKLPFAQGYLVLNSEPPGCVVSYRVDGGTESVVGVTDTIPSLPLGHQISVTVGKQGYLQVTKSILFQHSGDTLELGTLEPSQAFLTDLLYRAAQSGDIANIEKILKQYSAEYPSLLDQPSATEPDAPTPLLGAVRRGQIKAVDYLVKSGANVNRANRFRVTPLFEAARRGSAAMVRTLLDAHADVRFKNLSGQTPIFAVVLSSHNLEVLNLLMSFGADPNVRDVSGETPLLLAEENQNDDILHALQHPPVRVVTP